VASKEPVVAIVFGSFHMGLAEDAARALARMAPPGWQVRQPVSGEDFDFDSLAHTDVLIVCTSSANGFPPPNYAEFAHQLLLAAETGEPDGLAHLQHAVWGEGDPRWQKTFMNVPRFTDLLLEECGSRRFFARGESMEPHAPTRLDRCESSDWAPAMWKALGSAQAADPAVAWDAQWAYLPSEHHHDMRIPSLEALVRRHGELRRPTSSFASPDDEYRQLLDSVRREAEERQARARARAAAKG